MALKEFTLNIDVAVYAENESKAIQKVGRQLYKGGFKYWTGDVTEEKRKAKK